MIFVSPCHPATPLPLSVRRLRRTVTVFQKKGQLQAIPIPIIKWFGGAMEPALDQMLFGGHVVVVEIERAGPQ